MRSGPLNSRALVAVGVGGAVGGVLRWTVAAVVPEVGGFPWPTLLVNVSGCFLLALLLTSPMARDRPVLAAGLGPGLLGGYTTLSAYAEETRALLADAEPALASSYLVGSVAACLLAVAAARRWSSR